jgi:Arc/MetJ-type ribon-helix-helix transcriptional regulator
MGAVQLPDEFQRETERQVAEGRAANATAFVEEAVLRLLDDDRLEHQDLQTAVQVGIADIDAGRSITVTTPEDRKRLHERLMARQRERLAAGEQSGGVCTVRVIKIE